MDLLPLPPTRLQRTMRSLARFTALSEVALDASKSKIVLVASKSKIALIASKSEIGDSKT